MFKRMRLTRWLRFEQATLARAWQIADATTNIASMVIALVTGFIAWLLLRVWLGESEAHDQIRSFLVFEVVAAAVWALPAFLFHYTRAIVQRYYGVILELRTEERRRRQLERSTRRRSSRKELLARFQSFIARGEGIQRSLLHSWPNKNPSMHGDEVRSFIGEIAAWLEQNSDLADYRQLFLSDAGLQTGLAMQGSIERSNLYYHLDRRLTRLNEIHRELRAASPGNR